MFFSFLYVVVEIVGIFIDVMNLCHNTNEVCVVIMSANRTNYVLIDMANQSTHRHRI